MEDAQPNERRLSRKGSGNIPRVRVAPGRRLVEVHLPRECRRGAPGSNSARKRWIEDQKDRLWSDRHLSVVSFKYLEHNDRVVFTCRNDIPVTRQASRFQSSGPRPSQTRPSSRVCKGSQRIASIPSSTHSAEPCATEIRLCPVQIVHASPPPRRLSHTTPSTESVINLTLDPDTVVETPFSRWSTFRSGQVDILLPPSGCRSPEAHLDTPPSFNQIPAQVAGQCKSLPVVRSSDSIPGCSMEDPPASSPVSDQVRQYHVLEPPPLSHPCDYSELLQVEAGMLPSPPDRGFTSACGNLPLSLGSHDKPRRILHDRDFTYVITAHGVIDQVGTASVLTLDRNIRSPPLPFEESVDDACLLSYQGDLVIFLGHVREQNQISFLSLGHGKIPRQIALHRNWNKLASGGYDHRVHLWDIAQDLSGASAVELAIKHASVVHSLLPIMDTSHKLVSVGADRDIPIYDLSAERVVQTLKTSCIPHHAHKTDSRFCTLLEVSHLETQFEVRDHRMSYRAVQRFGFPTEEKRGRFEKADSWSHFVVCGDKNGAVHLWDLRNVSTEVAFRRCFNDPVVQVVNIGPRLLGCSKRNELACFNFQSE